MRSVTRHNIDLPPKKVTLVGTPVLHGLIQENFSLDFRSQGHKYVAVVDCGYTASSHSAVPLFSHKVHGVCMVGVVGLSLTRT